MCIQIRFVSTEKTTRIASRASCFLVKLVTYIIIHSNILLLTCIYILPFIFHCIICFYLFTLWRFNKVNQSINKNIIFVRWWEGGGGGVLKSKNILTKKTLPHFHFILSDF